jgi:hypothetical protein
VDQVLHQLQGEAEGVNLHQDELRKLLTDVAAERLALLQRHEAGARVVSNYDFNNTYQYVIAREETQLSWLQSALAELGLALPQTVPPLPIPEVPKGKVDRSTYSGILADDARQLAAFVDRWRDRFASMTHARHRIMLGVILGESLEHRRLFEQAAGGDEDVIGRRTGGVARVGAVLPDRWQE